MTEDQEYWLDFYSQLEDTDEIAEFEDAHMLQEYEQFAHDYNAR